MHTYCPYELTTIDLVRLADAVLKGDPIRMLEAMDAAEHAEEAEHETREAA